MMTTTGKQPSIHELRLEQQALDRQIQQEQQGAFTQPASKASAEDEERDALAAEYEERTGKKPGRMKAETIREKLDELNDEQE
ncbi:hypothetical protein [Vreelandella populi]|uniref:hypothetical protein n=1 Tax=Vreelandella populi TaxID=2498858 RepID=UPI000F8F3656|nr:hypothetical protein [Halomonas populi]RUR52701.1 hypothetical protein ELY40_11665 [Halomonas populi]